MLPVLSLTNVFKNLVWKCHHVKITCLTLLDTVLCKKVVEGQHHLKMQAPLGESLEKKIIWLFAHFLISQIWLSQSNHGGITRDDQQKLQFTFCYWYRSSSLNCRWCSLKFLSVALISWKKNILHSRSFVLLDLHFDVDAIWLISHFAMFRKSKFIFFLGVASELQKAKQKFLVYQLLKRS